MATASYKCPNCGGSLVFEPDLQKSKCEYCLSVFSGEELERFSRAMEARAEEEGKKSEKVSAGVDEVADVPVKGYICNNCGAEVVTESTTSATFCFYCHSPVLLTDRLTGDFRPTRIIPFAFDKDKAIAKFLSWAKTRRFVPRSFYASSQLEKITGVYVPYWMADTRAAIDYDGRAYNRRVWLSGNTEYTETKEYRIARHGSIDVNHIHEIANQKLDHRLLEAISPFDASTSLDFSMSYLSGFFAEKYDIARETIQPRIEERARQYVNAMIHDTLSGYQRVEMDRAGLDLSFKGWDYVLFPAWILTYQYRGKTYIYAVNGQNGKSFGELPVDQKKLGLTAGLIAAILLVLSLVGGLLLW